MTKGGFCINDGNNNDTKNLIGRVRKISVLHVQHALTDKSVSSSAKQQREITTFTVLMTTWAQNRKSLIVIIANAARSLVFCSAQRDMNY